MARGTFQGNLQGTPSRPLEMLTSSKAVTASYAETASRLGVNKVGDSGNPVYFNNGIPVADSKTKGIVDWVTNNSGSISGATGSSADVAVRVTGLEGKSGSWDSSSKWVGDNSASLLNPATLIISKSLGVPSAGNISYNPFKSASITIAVPSTPGHIGAAPANHTHSTSQVNGLDAFTASVKSDLAEISGKTGSYAPKDDYLPIGGGTITGSLVISNDLTVKGTTVSIDAQNLNVKDKLILVAFGSNTRAAADGAGIAVPTASAGEGGAARIQYDGTANVFTASVGFKAPSFTGNVTGNLTGTASFATSASKAISSSYANTATSASEATHAVSASEAVHAITASHAVNAKTALTASYLEGGASIVVNTASYAKTASEAQKVAWTAVDGRPSFYTASFVAGAFSGVQFNPTGGFAQVKVPSITTHITGLDAVTASVKLMVSKSASWDNVANTASAAYAAASQALATASVAQKEAESASYWKTEASKSAASASTFKTTAQTAATQANAASQSAKSASNAANEASQSAKTAATVATNWSLSASNAANIANVASQSAKTAATTAQGWVTSASKAAQDAEEYRDTASGSMEDARFYSSQAATNATLSSTYAVQSSASAQLAAASASSAATYATRAQQSASNAHTSKNSAAASASAAAASATTAANWAVSASASANQIQADTTVAANWAASSSKYATNASASAALLYKATGSATQPVYITANGPTPANAYSTLFTNFVETKNVLTASVGGTTKYATIHTASYALIAESVKDGAGLVVNTASYALQAGQAVKLIGTSGSTSLPVWVNAGVPTAITKLAGIPVTASTLRATSTLDVAGNAVINGDLTVKGTTTAIDATHLNVKDTLILLASGSTTQAAANGAGIAIQTASATTQAAREGAAARFQYRSSDNKFTASVGIVAPDFTGNLTGTASHATKADSVNGISAATITGSITAAINALVNTSGSAWKTDNNTTYTFANGTKGSTGFSVTPSGGSAQNVTVGLAQQAASASILAASANADRPVALLETSSATAGAVIYDTAVTFNPSSNILKATNISATNVTASTGFRGNLTGTASFATSASRAVSAETADTAVKATMIDSASNQVIYDPTAECFRFVFA